MAEGDKYTRITESQLELWLKMPVTQMYLQALAWELEKVIQDFKPTLQSGNSDHSHAQLFEREGRTIALKRALNPQETLERSQLYENPTRSEEAD